MAEERDKALDVALGQIEKQFGKGSVMRMGDSVSMGIESIPTGALSLDLALGIGGLPRGRVVEIFGPESSGKSTLAMHCVAEAQRNGGICAYIDAEHAMDPVYAGAIGVNVDDLLISQPDTGEQALEIADMLIRSGALDILVIDSVAALTPRAEIEGEMGDTHVGLQARLMSQALRKLTGTLNKSDTIAIFINQLREKIGVMYGSPETTPGGRALKFYSSIRLDIRRIETIKDGAEMVGSRTRVKVVKNKCVAAGTMVFDPTTGITHRIEDIVERGEGAAVVAADKAGKLHVRPIVARMDQGEHEVIGLHLRGGTELWVTTDHKVLTDTGWREAGELGVGDRLARPRQALGFGEEEPVRPAHARMLGYMIGDSCDLEKRIPAWFFKPEVSAEAIGNLLFGLWESNGWASREQTGAVRCGFATISEQLAHQLHWLLLRFGIGSSVRRDLSIQKRPSIIGEWGGQGTHSCYQVRIGGMDNVARFAESVPMWGHKGKKLTEVLGEPAPVRYRGSQQGYLSIAQTEPILAYLERRGVTAALAAQLVSPMGGDPKGGMRQVLGASRLRRDRVQVLAEALESPFLAEVLDEEVWYDRITAVSPPEWRPIYDIEVAEHHTFVANDVVVSNCARPFQQAEFDIMYGSGISREGSLLDVAVDLGFIKKSGAWFTYEGEQLGQGRENVKTFLRENPQLMAEVDERVRQHLAPSEGEEAEVDPAADDADPDDEPISLSD
jgi:protein RecA